MSISIDLTVDQHKPSANKESNIDEIKPYDDISSEEQSFVEISSDSELEPSFSPVRSPIGNKIGCVFGPKPKTINQKIKKKKRLRKLDLRARLKEKQSKLINTDLAHSEVQSKKSESKKSFSPIRAPMSVSYPATNFSYNQPFTQPFMTTTKPSLLGHSPTPLFLPPPGPPPFPPNCLLPRPPNCLPPCPPSFPPFLPPPLMSMMPQFIPSAVGPPGLPTMPPFPVNDSYGQYLKSADNFIHSNRTDDKTTDANTGRHSESQSRSNSRNRHSTIRSRSPTSRKSPSLHRRNYRRSPCSSSRHRNYRRSPSPSSRQRNYRRSPSPSSRHRNYRRSGSPSLRHRDYKRSRSPSSRHRDYKRSRSPSSRHRDHKRSPSPRHSKSISSRKVLHRSRSTSRSRRQIPDKSRHQRSPSNHRRDNKRKISPRTPIRLAKDVIKTTVTPTPLLSASPKVSMATSRELLSTTTTASRSSLTPLKSSINDNGDLNESTDSIFLTKRLPLNHTFLERPIMCQSRNNSEYNDENSNNLVTSYKILTEIGKGTYGHVYKAQLLKTGQWMALKKICLKEEGEGVPITTTREIKLLFELRHPNIIKLRDIVVNDDAAFDIIQREPAFFLVFEYMEHDLQGLLQCGLVQFHEDHIASIIYQLLQALHYCHKKGVMHRDIKCSNILINNKCEVKLADFGLARMFSVDDRHRCYTSRVITLWYRPPELLLGKVHYDTAVDIWSVGCILGELFTKRPMFSKHEEMEQLKAIAQVCGSPTPAVWSEVAQLPLFVHFKPDCGFQQRRLKEEYAFLPRKAVDLLDWMLQLDPAKRCSALEALESSWLLNLDIDRILPPKFPDFQDCHEMWSKQRQHDIQEMVKKGYNPQVQTETPSSPTISFTQAKTVTTPPSQPTTQPEASRNPFARRQAKPVQRQHSEEFLSKVKQLISVLESVDSTVDVDSLINLVETSAQGLDDYSRNTLIEALQTHLSRRSEAATMNRPSAGYQADKVYSSEPLVYNYCPSSHEGGSWNEETENPNDTEDNWSRPTLFETFNRDDDDSREKNETSDNYRVEQLLSSLSDKFPRSDRGSASCWDAFLTRTGNAEAHSRVGSSRYRLDNNTK